MQPQGLQLHTITWGLTNSYYDRMACMTRSTQLTLCTCVVLYCALCALTGDASGNTQTPIDARFKCAPSGMGGHSHVTVADSAPQAHSDQPGAPQVGWSWHS